MSFKRLSNAALCLSNDARSSETEDGIGAETRGE